MTVPVSPDDPLRMSFSVETGELSEYEYVVALPLERSEGGYRALTPTMEVCPNCDGEAAYVPGAHRESVRLNATLTASGAPET